MSPAMTKVEKDIAEKATELDQLEKDFLKHFEKRRPESQEELKAWYEKAGEISINAFDLKLEILEYFGETSDIMIHDPKVRRVLEGIRGEGDKFLSISYFEGLAERINEKVGRSSERIPLSVAEYLSSKFDLLDDFRSWFDLWGYYTSKVKIGPIISSSKISDNLKAYFEEVKEAYAFGLYRSSVALSRALLELSLLDKLTRQGHFRDARQRVQSIDVAKEDSLYSFINKAKWEKLLDSRNTDIAHQVRTAANKVLHIKGQNHKVKEKEAAEIIFNTIRVIEWLYR